MNLMCPKILVQLFFSHRQHTMLLLVMQRHILYVWNCLQTGIFHFGYLHDFETISYIKQMVLLYRCPLRERNQLKIRNNNAFCLL